MQLIKPGTKINFMGRVPVFGGLSIALVVLALVGLVVRGLNWGIDFSGGTELQIRFEKEVPTAELRGVLNDLGFAKNEVQPYGAAEDHEYLVRIERITSLTEERVGSLRQQATDHFGADRLRSLTFQPEEGDRLLLSFNLETADVHVKEEMDAPAAEETDAPSPASAPAADSQPASAPAPVDEADAATLARVEASLTALRGEVLDFFGKAGLDLRRSEPIRLGQPHQGRVEAEVYFKGVADRIVTAMTAKFGEVENRRTDYVDSNVSKELRTDGALAILYALFGILLYIAFRFNFYFSPGAVVALIHDVAITMGVFAWTQLEFNLTSVAALLTIIGYSLNDTIVVYDRIRETVPADDKLKDDLASYVNRAVNDTLSRTLLTSITTLLVIIALLVFGVGVIKTFGIALCIGVLIGTYSSIFVASPVYLLLKRMVPAAK